MDRCGFHLLNLKHIPAFLNKHLRTQRSLKFCTKMNTLFLNYKYAPSRHVPIQAEISKGRASKYSYMQKHSRILLNPRL